MKKEDYAKVAHGMYQKGAIPYSPATNKKEQEEELDKLDFRSAMISIKAYAKKFEELFAQKSPFTDMDTNEEASYWAIKKHSLDIANSLKNIAGKVLQMGDAQYQNERNRIIRKYFEECLSDSNPHKMNDIKDYIFSKMIEHDEYKGERSSAYIYPAISSLIVDGGPYQKVARGIYQISKEIQLSNSSYSMDDVSKLLDRGFKLAEVDIKSLVAVGKQYRQCIIHYCLCRGLYGPQRRTRRRTRHDNVRNVKLRGGKEMAEGRILAVKIDGNMLSMVNKYMDAYQKSKELSDKAKAEKYAKITAKTIIYSGEGDAASYGQNAFFYDAAEGLLTSVILLVAEYCKPEERHIISVFKMIQDLLAPSSSDSKSSKKMTQFQVLMTKLPDTHKAKWFAGAVLNKSEQAMQSVLSTALSRLNAFLDSEMEQILCFDTAIDAEKFCNTKSALFLIMPEEDNTKYFLISLIVQQFYREMLAIADESNGKLKNRVMFYLDEIGTIPKIDSAEMMFSAGRSRRISIIAIIQSKAQLEKNYGKEGAEIIWDNCQLTVFGGFAPNSETAEVMSKNLGEQTILSGSVTQSKGDGSRSLQMMSRPLMTVDELKTLPRFHFIITKTGCHPMRTKLDLFFNWGIELKTEYVVEKKEVREVHYAGKEDLMREIEIREGQKEMPDTETTSAKSATGGQNMTPVYEEVIESEEDVIVEEIEEIGEKKEDYEINAIKQHKARPS